MLVGANNSKSKTITLAELVSAVRNSCNFSLVRSLLAVLLIVAAYLKSDNLLAGSTTSWPEFGLVMFELCLAAVMLSSAPASVAWWLGTGCFTAFAIVAGYKTLAGYESCGCFGAVSTPPWIALIIDVLVLIALCATRRSTAVNEVGRSQAALLSWIPSLQTVGMACVLLIGLKSSWIIAADHGERSIDPRQWQNARLPLLDSIDIGQQLSKGEWLIVFHRSGCESCEQLIEKINLEHLIHFKSAHAPIVLVEIANSNVPDLNSHSSVAANYGVLKGLRYGWIPTPLLVALHDGFVVEVIVSDDLLAMIASAESTE